MNKTKTLKQIYQTVRKELNKYTFGDDYTMEFDVDSETKKNNAVLIIPKGSIITSPVFNVLSELDLAFYVDMKRKYVRVIKR